MSRQRFSAMKDNTINNTNSTQKRESAFTMSSSEISEEETELQTPKFIRRNSRFSLRSSTPSGTPCSLANRSIVFGPISEEVLRIWRLLPEDIRLDPSMGAIQREYERVNAMVDRSQAFGETLDSGTVVVNMSITAHQNEVTKTNDKKTATDKEHFDAQVHGPDRKQRPIFRYTKIFLLICCWIMFTLLLMTKSPKFLDFHRVSIRPDQVENYAIADHTSSRRVNILVEGPFLLPDDDPSSTNLFMPSLTVWLELNELFYDNSTMADGFNIHLSGNRILTTPWVIPVLPQEILGMSPPNRQNRTFELQNFPQDYSDDPNGAIVVAMKTNLSIDLRVSIAYDFAPITAKDGLVWAAVILLGLYILIIFEIVHRTLAAMMASTMSIAVLAIMNERPTMTEIISWIDVDTLLLLFAMMVLVAIVAETGIFDYLAVYAYQVTGGKLWPLINTLCFFTAFLSSFLDNVTTVLLMTPVTIKICEVMELNPVPILTAMLVFSNIGGTSTPVGDPPNVIIASNPDVIKAGIGFSTFVAHMSVGVVIVLAVIYVQLRFFIFRDVSVLAFDEPKDVQELRHEIAIWQRAACSLSSYSKDENLVRETLKKKIQRLTALLKKKLMTGSFALQKYKATLEELQEKYPIRDKWLLVKSSFALVFVITLFFLHNVPNVHLSLGWTALLGVLLLLILADSLDIDGLLARVEWSTLLFFAALFILMEALSRLGLIAWIGKVTENVILSVDEGSRLAVAIMLILWVSAFASAFVDNVPLATMMVRIATSLSKNEELNLPLQPLIWALAFGACLGGNATLIGATANVVCAGVAEQHGYRFTFMQFFKVGFPIVITSTTVTTIYLIIAHVVFDWN